MILETLGWNSFFARQFETYESAGMVPARVAARGRSTFLLYTAAGEIWGEIAGRLRLHAECGGDLPVCGDWAAVQPLHGEGKAVIHAVLDRKSRFSRKHAGDRTEEQIVAANIDTAFIVCGLDGDFNPRRIERYLLLACESGAVPVIVLNKSDLCDWVEERTGEAAALLPGVGVITTSALENRGIDALRNSFGPGETAVLLGSSGVGKSTLVNRLLGSERQRVQEVVPGRQRGRHTTTLRELIRVPGGGLIIDTPGMRELQIWAAEDGVSAVFRDVEDLALRCRFRDCRHGPEHGCALRKAVQDGELPPGRLESYLKLQREVEYLESRLEHSAGWIEKQRWRKTMGKTGLEIRRRSKSRQRYW
jgi:ribosome biogenesis GTPase